MGEDLARPMRNETEKSGGKEPNGVKKTSVHDGHRGRLIAKMEKGALEEHEWLEALLFNALPRRDTNPVAHALLETFGCIENIFSADVKKLTSVKGVGENVAAYLRCIGKFYEKYVPSESGVFPKRYRSDTFVDYLVGEYSMRRLEVFDVYLLDRKARIFYRKRFEGVNENKVEIPIADVAETIAVNRPSGLILVHNHPFTSSKPSAADDETTGKMQILCSSFGVLLCDHYIVGGRSDVYSYYAAGEMQYINSNYTLDKVLSSAEMYKEAKDRQRVFSGDKPKESAFRNRYDLIERALSEEAFDEIDDVFENDPFGEENAPF